MQASAGLYLDPRQGFAYLALASGHCRSGFSYSLAQFTEFGVAHAVHVNAPTPQLVENGFAPIPPKVVYLLFRISTQCVKGRPVPIQEGIGRR